jgi:hypothetical protein
MGASSDMRGNLSVLGYGFAVEATLYQVVEFRAVHVFVVAGFIRPIREWPDESGHYKPG